MSINSSKKVKMVDNCITSSSNYHLKYLIKIISLYNFDSPVDPLRITTKKLNNLIENRCSVNISRCFFLSSSSVFFLCTFLVKTNFQKMTSQNIQSILIVEIVYTAIQKKHIIVKQILTPLRI